jgi:hypothetical protein
MERPKNLTINILHHPLSAGKMLIRRPQPPELAVTARLATFAPVIFLSNHIRDNLLYILLKDIDE